MRSFLLIFLGISIGFTVDDMQQRIAHAQMSIPGPPYPVPSQGQSVLTLKDGFGRMVGILMDNEGRLVCSPAK